MFIKGTMCGLGISKVSVVIPTDGKRVVELESVVSHLESLGFKDIILAKGKKRMMNRYDACKKAKNDIIYTQDDDCIIGNVPELIKAYDEDKIVCNVKLERMVYYERMCAGKIALVGYGAVFHKDMLKVFKQYTNYFEEDEVLHREADRVFTWLNRKELVLADKFIKDFPVAYEGMSMDNDHFPSMYIMIDRLKQL